MPLTLANRVNAIKPSPTLTITAKAAELRSQGKAIISLSAGEPDFDTPSHISEAAKLAINNGQTRYTSVDGIPSLKQAIIEKFNNENDLSYSPNQILVSAGAKHSIYNCLQALLNPGDEVIIPAPYWVSYPDMTLLADAVPKIITTSAANRFKMSAQQLATAINEKTRLVFLNSPSNPTGMAYSADELTALANTLKQHPQVWILSDDIYEHIYWGEQTYQTILNVCPELYDRTIVVNGVSKAYAMTGWRIGYAAGHPELIQAMKKIQSQSTSNPCSISQHAAQAALAGQQDCVAEMCTHFKRRHDYLVDALNSIDGVNCYPGDGTFYAFPDVSGLIESMSNIADDVELAAYLLEKAGIALVPGSAFGSPQCLRLSFAISDDALERAMAQFRQAIEKA